MCEAVLFYAQLVQQRLKDSGFYEDVSAFKTSDDVKKFYVSSNDPTNLKKLF